MVRLIFAQFEELGTLGGLLRYLARHDIRLGVRVREGPGKGQLVWRRPNRATLQNLLKHPLYAGAYVYGRRQMDRRRSQPDRPQSGRVVMARSDVARACCRTAARPTSPGSSMSAIVARLAANRDRASTLGAVRNGAALLAGLVVCAGVESGSGSITSSPTAAPSPSPTTVSHRRNHYGEPLCQHVAGPCLDDFVTRQVLAALEPAALELSLAAAEQVEQERATLHQLWEQRRERAAYEDGACGQTVPGRGTGEPLGRPDAGAGLGGEAAGAADAGGRVSPLPPATATVLTAEEREAIRQLAADIPALWNAPTTTDADRKEIIRQVVERVEVEAQGTSEQVRVRITWAGGGQTEGVLVRPIARYTDRSDYARLCARVQELTAAGWSLEAIARQLEADGFPPLRSRTGLECSSVQTLRRQLGLSNTHRHGPSREALGPDEWWAREVAERLAVSSQQPALLDRARRGAGTQGARWVQRWIVWADAAELERLRAYRHRDIAAEHRRRWTAAYTREAHQKGATP